MLGGLDQALRTIFGPPPEAQRLSPAAALPEADLDAAQRELAARLMRINHAGEICAQALYQGQAVTAQLPNVREKMEQAAAEENDHLAWTAERLREFGSHTSVISIRCGMPVHLPSARQPDWWATSGASGLSPKPSAKS